jgi:hypothetical protein
MVSALILLAGGTFLTAFCLLDLRSADARTLDLAHTPLRRWRQIEGIAKADEQAATRIKFGRLMVPILALGWAATALFALWKALT